MNAGFGDVKSINSTGFGDVARVVGAYNAGPSRAAEWNRVPAGGRPLTADEFIARIDFPTTRAYVSNILERYRKKKIER